MADLGAVLDNEDRCPGISSRTSAADVARRYNPEIQKRFRLRSKGPRHRMGDRGL
jgi:hypothetical protein